MTASFDLLQQSIQQQQQDATAARDAAGETLQLAREVFDFLGREIADLRGLAGAGMSGVQARAFIDAAIIAARATGTLPDQDALAQAVIAARGELDPRRFATSFEQRRDSLRLANQLAELQNAAGTQASLAERALQVAEEQLAVLEQSAEQARTDFDANMAAVREQAAEQLAAAQAQLDALRGVDASVLSVTAAIQNLASAINAEQAAVAAAAAARSQEAAISRSGRTTEQLYAMLPNDFFERDAAGKIDWYNDNAITVGELTNAGVPWSDIEWMLRNDYKGFASGGLHAGGLRLVGEEGPELEVTGPSRIYSFDQTRELLGNSQRRDEFLVAEIRALREENAAQARAMVNMQQRMTRLIERWDGDGIPETRAVA